MRWVVCGDGLRTGESDGTRGAKLKLECDARYWKLPVDLYRSGDDYDVTEAMRRQEDEGQDEGEEEMDGKVSEREKSDLSYKMSRHFACIGPYQPLDVISQLCNY